MPTFKPPTATTYTHQFKPKKAAVPIKPLTAEEEAEFADAGADRHWRAISLERKVRERELLRLDEGELPDHERRELIATAEFFVGELIPAFNAGSEAERVAISTRMSRWSSFVRKLRALKGKVTEEV